MPVINKCRLSVCPTCGLSRCPQYQQWLPSKSWPRTVHAEAAFVQLAAFQELA